MFLELYTCHHVLKHGDFDTLIESQNVNLNYYMFFQSKYKSSLKDLVLLSTYCAPQLMCFQMFSNAPMSFP